MQKNLRKFLFVSVLLVSAAPNLYAMEGGDGGLWAKPGENMLYSPQGYGKKLATINVRAGNVIDGIGVCDPATLVEDLKTTTLGLKHLKNLLSNAMQGGAAYISKDKDTIAAVLKNAGGDILDTLHATAYTTCGLFPSSTVTHRYSGGEGGDAYYGFLKDNQWLVGVSGTTGGFKYSWYDKEVTVVTSLQFDILEPSQDGKKFVRNKLTLRGVGKGATTKVGRTEKHDKPFSLSENGKHIVGFQTKSGALLDKLGIITESFQK